MAQTVPLGVLGLHVPPGTHICSFCRGTQGRDEIVLPFLAEGMVHENPHYIEPGRFLARHG